MEILEPKCARSAGLLKGSTLVVSLPRIKDSFIENMITKKLSSEEDDSEDKKDSWVERMRNKISVEGHKREKPMLLQTNERWPLLTREKSNRCAKQDINFSEDALFKRAVMKAKDTLKLSSEDGDFSEDNGSSEDDGPLKDNGNENEMWKHSSEEEDSNNEMKDNISPYERMIMENKKERLKFLESLQINEAKNAFANSVASFKPKHVPGVKKPVVPLPKREQRKRLAQPDNLSEDALLRRALKQAKDSVVIPSVLHFKEIKGNRRSFSKTFGSLFSVSKVKYDGIQYTKKMFQKIERGEKRIGSVLPTRTTSMVFHPNPENIIVCAGSILGHIGLWNVLSDVNAFLYLPHSASVSKLQFDPLHSNVLISSSEDGTLSCCDMEREVFQKVYDVSKVTSCSYFDFLSPNILVISQRNGRIPVVDMRTLSKVTEKTARESVVECVCVHPINKNYFVTAHKEGSITLWDLRSRKNYALANIQCSKKRVISAFFSPVSGNSILSTSVDDSYTIFDCSDLSQELKIRATYTHTYATAHASIIYNNRKRSWKKSNIKEVPLYPKYCATYLPNSDENFIFGTRRPPTELKVFDDQVTNIHNFKSAFTSAISVFHPSCAAWARNGTDGKIYVQK